MPQRVSLAVRRARDRAIAASPRPCAKCRNWQEPAEALIPIKCSKCAMELRWKLLSDPLEDQYVSCTISDGHILRKSTEVACCIQIVLRF